MVTTTLALILLARQDKPVDIPKSELPKSAVCVVCRANGESHGEERPAAGVRYKGIAYYFCGLKEVEQFKADPEAFMPPVLPRPMPDFSLVDTNGQAWGRDSFKGRVILIDFWATWCKPCKEMKPILEKCREKYSTKGFEVLSVSIDESVETLTNFLKRNRFTNPVLFDSSQTWAAWKVRVIPAFFVVKDGIVVDQWVGKKTEKEVLALVAQHIGSSSLSPDPVP